MSQRTRQVVVALSGGVDSAVAAALLVEQGYEVSAVLLRLWAEARGGGGDNRCCTSEAQVRARQIADLLRIPFQVLDVREPFRRAVVESFVAEYVAARTPNPCIVCNREVRFGILFRWARQQGADFLATGHYARVQQAPDGFRLLRGRDRNKDQSYVLHVLTQEHLAHVRFPLGEMTKQQVRRAARARGLPVAEQAESQDVCFLADGNYRRFLAQEAPRAIRPGPILDRSGRLLGQHQGLVNYTIGQRKGIGIAASGPLYVLALESEQNALIVGPAEELGQEECMVEHMHYVSGQEPSEPFEADAQIRYRHRQVRVTAIPLANRRLLVRFSQRQRDVTPGQYLVLYDGETVLGGGVICAPGEIVLE